MADVPDSIRNGRVLVALFVVLAVAAAVATIVLLGGGIDELLYGLGGGVVFGVVVVGSYVLGRRYGQPHSHAVAQAATMLGVVLLAAVVAELLMDAGQLSNAEIALGVGGSFGVMALLILGVAALDRVTAPA